MGLFYPFFSQSLCCCQNFSDQEELKGLLGDAYKEVDYCHDAEVYLYIEDLLEKVLEIPTVQFQPKIFRNKILTKAKKFQNLSISELFLQ